MARRKHMEHELIDRIASLLRESGFRNLIRRKSSISETLAADSEGTNVVVHFSQAATAPTAAAVPHSMAPKDLDILMKATMPGLSGPPGTDTLRTLRQGSSGTAGQSR
jgi:CheY-like chemotaxis protein